MRFRVGQLVRPLEWVSDVMELLNVPPAKAVTIDGEMPRVTGTLAPDSVALVVALDRSDGTCIYLLGPSGGGWGEGALLRVVQG